MEWHCTTTCLLPVMSLLFSSIEVTRQAFYRSSFTYAIVNLKPIVPGHVLVIPRKPAARLSELDPKELFCLMTSIQTVGSAIEKAYGAQALTIACQDGKAAGQSIPHVHFHLLPRKISGDEFSGDNNDKIYPALEVAEETLPDHLLMADSLRRRNLAGTHLKVDADEDRLPRTLEEMEKEANWLKTFFSPDAQPSCN